MTDRWDRLQSLFELAADLDEVERQVLVARETADDPGLRAELESLLRYSGSADAMLDRVVGGAVVDLDRRSGLVPGQRFDRYSIRKELGRGGSGTVYLADSTEGLVAIKVLWAGRWHPELVRRFQRERRILQKLSHPFITRIYDSGTTEDGVLYEVMEYVPGEHIDTFCDRRMLDTEDRIRLFLRVCEAVEHAHEHGIVHRDLKPGNILVQDDGTPKLLDFGIAKPLDPTDLDGTRFSTRTGMRLMTPAYASPEQVRSLPATPTSDVYSLGVILYELVTGRMPYTVQGGYPGEVLLAILDVEAVWPDARSGDGGLGRVVLAALRKDPERRLATVREFAGALRLEWLLRSPTDSA